MQRQGTVQHLAAQAFGFCGISFGQHLIGLAQELP